MQAPLDVCLQAPQNRCSLWMEQRDKINQKFKSGIDFLSRSSFFVLGSLGFPKFAKWL